MFSSEMVCICLGATELLCFSSESNSIFKKGIGNSMLFEAEQKRNIISKRTKEELKVILLDSSRYVGFLHESSFSFVPFSH